MTREEKLEEALLSVQKSMLSKGEWGWRAKALYVIANALRKP